MVMYYNGLCTPDERKIKMLFTEWLRKQAGRSDPVGSVARYVAIDISSGCHPGGNSGWPVSAAHLIVEHNLDDAAFDALWDAVREHVTALDGAGRLRERMVSSAEMHGQGQAEWVMCLSLGLAAELPSVADAPQSPRPAA